MDSYLKCAFDDIPRLASNFLITSIQAELFSPGFSPVSLEDILIRPRIPWSDFIILRSGNACSKHRNSALKNGNSSPRKCKFGTQKLKWLSKQTVQNSVPRKWKFCTRKKEILLRKWEVCTLPIPWKDRFSMIFHAALKSKF